MHLRFLLSHTLVNWSSYRSLCATFVELPCAHLKTDGTFSDHVHYDFWYMGKSLHLSPHDMACILNGKFELGIRRYFTIYLNGREPNPPYVCLGGDHSFYHAAICF